MIEKDIETHPAADRKFAMFDIKNRTDEAFDRYSDFFNSDSHIEKVKMVRKIVNNFFKIKKGEYETPRTNRGDPMTVIKIEDPEFPNRLTKDMKQRVFYQPLEELGVEIKYAKGTNSWLFRVR